jgi:hypothetical protein
MQNLKKILVGFKMLMAMLFTAVGLYCLIYPERINYLEKSGSLMFGSILIVYAMIRFYRVYRELTQKEQESN